MTIMTVDSHVHTRFSCDSEAEMSNYITTAKEKGIDFICFTEHVDFNQCDDGYRYYNAAKYWEAFHKYKENSGLVEITAGIEFSEPHLYSEELTSLSKYSYDFIIGSIHWVGSLFPERKTREQYSAKEFFTMYWNEMLGMVKQGGFDCVGHIDFPKRYYGELYYNEKSIREIFKYLVEKEIVIEINTSSLRKGLSETMPGREILELYKENGGQYVTIGSDAHLSKDLGEGIAAAKTLIREFGMKEVVYRSRTRQLI